MKSIAKLVLAVTTTALVSGYIGYLYAGYEDAFYCDKMKTPTMAL